MEEIYLSNSRKSGILLHISSLPGPFGIGDLGSNAERFAVFLSASGAGVWQVLPLTPVSGASGHSPYSSSSAFAGNLLFVSPEKMMKDGLISEDDIEPFLGRRSADADYTFASEVREYLLVKAWANFSSGDKTFSCMHEEFRLFREEEKFWLDAYSLFSVLKEKFGYKCWNEWPCEYRRHDRQALEQFVQQDENAERISFISFTQFIFFRQWRALHEYCRSCGILIMGDVPMFVALDSSDVWADQDFFDLDADGRPNCVAGVPPDYFCETGQRWGNPLYMWDRMEADGFRWWVSRIKASLAMCDFIRIDHFRGFCGYWAIPACEGTAENGEWRRAPGRALFEVLEQKIAQYGGGSLPMVAEDLGIITDDVGDLMDKAGIPGMKVLLFAFGDGVGTNPYAPHNITRNSVVYTGTHDNNTVRGWWDNEASASDRRRFQSYIGHDIVPDDAAKYMTRLALASVADLAIIPIQDILGLDGSSRMNTPGECRGNWMWRLTQEEFEYFASDGSAEAYRLREMNSLYGRCK